MRPQSSDGSSVISIPPEGFLKFTNITARTHDTSDDEEMRLRRGLRDLTKPSDVDDMSVDNLPSDLVLSSEEDESAPGRLAVEANQGQTGPVLAVAGHDRDDESQTTDVEGYEGDRSDDESISGLSTKSEVQVSVSHLVA